MNDTFSKVRSEAVQYALCLLVGVLGGWILLSDVPPKWEFAFLAVLGTAVVMLVVGSPKRVTLFVLAFSVPMYFGKAFIISPEPGSMTTGVDISVSDVLAISLLLIYLARLARREVRICFFPLIMIPALTWLVLSSFSLLDARDGDLVVIHLLNMGKLLLLGWVVASSIGERSDLEFLIAGMMLGLLFQVLVGVYQGVTGRPVGLEFLTETASVRQQMLGESVINRVQGTMGHPNTYAMYLTTVIPFVLALLLATTRPLLKVMMVVLLCLAGLALILSLSRSAWVTFMVTVGIILALAIRRKQIGLQTAVLFAGAGMLILLGITFFGPNIILSRLTSNDYGSAHSRITLARTALAIIRDHPWVGVGLNNYGVVAPQYDPAAYARLYVVHNAYLLIAAETGLVGLTVFLGLLAMLLIQAWRMAIWAHDDMDRVASAGVFAALVALAMHSATDYALLGSSRLLVHFWLLAGLVAVLSQRMEHERRRVGSTSNVSGSLGRNRRWQLEPDGEG